MKKEYTLRCESCDKDNVYITGTDCYDDEYLDTLPELVSKGEFGERLKKELKKYPNAKLEIEKAIYQCSKCGDYTLHDYVRVITPTGNVSDRYYCKKCGGSTRRLIDVKHANFHCPDCNNLMTVTVAPRKEFN